MDDLPLDELLNALRHLIPGTWMKSFKEDWVEFRLLETPAPSGFFLAVREREHTIFADICADRFLDHGVQEAIRSVLNSNKLNQGIKASLSDLGYVLETVDSSRGTLVKIGISLPERSDLLARHQLKIVLLSALGELLVASRVVLTSLENTGVKGIDQIILAEEPLPEGSFAKVLVNRYERDPRNRALALLHHGSACKACGLDLGARYGQLGAGKIHIHHVTPISQLGEHYLCDPATDLVPLCPNCHFICHQRTPPLDVGELREVLMEDLGR